MLRAALPMVFTLSLVSVGLAQAEKPRPPRVFFAFTNAPVKEAVDTIAKISGRNIVMPATLKGSVTVHLKNIPWDDALTSIVQQVDHFARKEADETVRILSNDTVVTRSFTPKELGLRSQPADGHRLYEAQDLEAVRRMLTPKVGQLQFFRKREIISIKDKNRVVNKVQKYLEELAAQIRVVNDLRRVRAEIESLLSGRTRAWPRLALRDELVKLRAAISALEAKLRPAGRPARKQ